MPEKSAWGLWFRLLRSAWIRTSAAAGAPSIPSIETRTVVREYSIPRVLQFLEILGAPASSRRKFSQDPLSPLPPTLLQHLAGKLHLELLGHPGFPFNPLGLIHFQNEITQRSELRLSDFPLELRASLGDGGAHPRGRLVRIETYARSVRCLDPAPAWSSTIVALMRTSSQARRPGRSRLRPESSESLGSGGFELGSYPDWELPPDLGRRFSFLVGDFNPIHLWAWSARLFGFQRPIIHGMWSLARAIVELETELPQLPRRIVAAFKRPIELPARANLQARKLNHGSLVFEVRDGKDRPAAILGSITSFHGDTGSMGRNEGNP